MPKVFKLSDGGLALRIPDEIIKFMNLDEHSFVSFKPVSSKVVAVFPCQPSSTRTPKETTLIRKLMSIRFSERTKENVDKKLTDEEKKLLERLVKEKAVSFYDKGKYKGRGVYSISKQYYPTTTLPHGKEQGTVYFKDFLITDDYSKAQNLFRVLDEQLADGTVLAVPGFDKKFYFIKQHVFDDARKKMGKLLSKKTGVTLDELASKTKLDEQLCKTVIELMRESGDVLEKRKNHYFSV